MSPSSEIRQVEAPDVTPSMILPHKTGLGNTGTGEISRWTTHAREADSLVGSHDLQWHPATVVAHNVLYKNLAKDVCDCLPPCLESPRCCSPPPVPSRLHSLYQKRPVDVPLRRDQSFELACSFCSDEASGSSKEAEAETSRDNSEKHSPETNGEAVTSKPDGNLVISDGQNLTSLKACADGGTVPTKHKEHKTWENIKSDSPLLTTASTPVSPTMEKAEPTRIYSPPSSTTSGLTYSEFESSGPPTQPLEYHTNHIIPQESMASTGTESFQDAFDNVAFITGKSSSPDSYSNFVQSPTREAPNGGGRLDANRLGSATEDSSPAPVRSPSRRR